MDIPDHFWYEKVKVSIALPMGMRYHVYRHSIHGNVYIRSMIYIKATQENLFRFTSAGMLTNKKPRYQSQHFLRISNVPHLYINLADWLVLVAWIQRHLHGVHFNDPVFKPDDPVVF